MTHMQRFASLKKPTLSPCSRKEMFFISFGLVVSGVGPINRVFDTGTGLNQIQEDFFDCNWLLSIRL